MRSSEHGFSLVEVLVAAALFAVVTFAAFGALRQMLAGAQQLAARQLALGGLERLTGQLRAEARSATAIWVGASAGSGHDDCTQLDFLGTDAAGPKFWSYRTFPNHSRAPRPGATRGPADDAIPGDALQRVAGSAPLAACAPTDPAATVLQQVAGFSLRRFDPSALALHADPYLAQPDSPFLAPVPADPQVPLGLNDAAGNPIRGGNTLTELQLDTAEGSRIVDLVPGVFPSGFTALLSFACNARCRVGHDTNAPKTLTQCDVSWSTDPSRFPQLVQGYAYDSASGSYELTPQGYAWAALFRFRYSDPRPVPPGSGDQLDRYVEIDNLSGGGTLAPPSAPYDSSAGLADAQAWYAALQPVLGAAMQQAFAAENGVCSGVNAQRTGPGYYDNG